MFSSESPPTCFDATTTSDSPFKPRQSRQSSGQRGGKKGHPGAGPKLLEPTEVEVALPPSCSCGHAAVSAPVPYRTHQVLELPPTQMEVTHFLLHQATCLGCGQTLSAAAPPTHASGDGPRLNALGRAGVALCGTVAQTLQWDR